MRTSFPMLWIITVLSWAGDRAGASTNSFSNQVREGKNNLEKEGKSDSEVDGFVSFLGGVKKKEREKPPSNGPPAAAATLFAHRRHPRHLSMGPPQRGAWVHSPCWRAQGKEQQSTLLFGHKKLLVLCTGAACSFIFAQSLEVGLFG